MKQRYYRLAMVLFLLLSVNSGFSAEPLTIGLDADLKSGSARSGIAIQRGMVLAMDQINNAGGVLGRKLTLVARDHRGNPARGVANMETFSAMPNLVAVVGGLHTPVALAQLAKIHEHRIIYLSPWAAGTPVVENGYNPNYVFRVSVRDQLAGPFLVRQALESGYRKLGLLLEQTGWGRSNNQAMRAALKERELEPVGIQWFLWGAKDMAGHIRALKEAEADIIMFVGNAPEGASLVKQMAVLPEKDRLPIISHWGITGGRFSDQAGDGLEKVDLKFLQTFSFLSPSFPDRAEAVLSAYLSKWPETGSARGVFAPAGTAHAYDLVFILKAAIEKAGTTEADKVRDALEHLGPYNGLVRNYDPPFSPERHDALDANDYRLARFAADGAIEPVIPE